MEDAVTTGSVQFTKINRDTATGKVFTLVYSDFDLGTEFPHPDYYQSGVLACDSSEDDESLCKGGLKAIFIYQWTNPTLFPLLLSVVN